MIALWVRGAAKDGERVACADVQSVIAALDEKKPSVAVVETEGHADFFDVRVALGLDAARKKERAQLASATRPSFECYGEETIAATATGWRIILRRMRFDGTPRGA